LKSLKLPLTAAFAVAAFSAQAADMYAPRVSAKDAPVYEAVPLWTGFYAGVNSGYGWGAKSGTLNTTATDNDAGLPLQLPVTDAGQSTLKTEGGFGGGQLGYNVQRDRLVFGIETDIQGSVLKGNTFSNASVQLLGAPLPAVETEAWAKSTLDWFGTVRGRLGYSLGNTLFFGDTLLYATGGFAYGGVRDTLGMDFTSGNAALHNATSFATGADSRKTTLTGWVVGGGVEVALSRSWSAKAEYQYIDLGSTNLAANTALSYSLPDPTDTGHAAVKIDHTYNTVRLGLNYRFNQAAEPLPLK
jgi:outer membrane immunogenic protein